MDYNFSILYASAAEAWQSVPLISLHLPIMGSVFRLNIWSVTTALAMLVLAVNHSLNHSRAQAGNSALSGFRKSVSGFWNTQTLERVHLKWRQLGARSAAFSENEDSLKVSLYTNRLPAAWSSLSDVQGKTTVVWLSVLFFLLLVSNSFGLVPLCSAITGQAGFTLGMSIALLSAVTYLGVKRQGMRFVRLFLPSGPSWPMAPLFILLESISYGFRAISLGTRLYCNMFAGHLLLHLFTSLSLVPVLCTPVLLGAPFTVIAAAILMALSALETIVAVLQSGVFCLLGGFYLHEVLSRKDPLASAV
uniref:ATP synthase subunit a n=1 Tax=Pectinodesmus pectinatus TaxID=91197 RepID=A0A2H4E8B5_9CHLO|nr:ATP synthase subunit 6 [Pectinodesmus pectinatus]ANG44799.1 ATP synthase subunit 6 [Pectinodesmus pectinatus]